MEKINVKWLKIKLTQHAYKLELSSLQLVGTYSTVVRSVSDPDSGIFWIRVRNPDPGA